MRELLLVLFALGTLANAFALETSICYDASVLVVAPSIGDTVLMSSRSDQNGACKALGYEKAAVGSAVFDCKVSANLSQVIVDNNGDVSSGDLGKNYCRIQQIICLNYVSIPQLKTHLISKPKHLQSEAPYSSRSNQNGVCKSQGYEKAAVGSAVFDCTPEANLSQVVVDNNGNVSSGDLGREYCRINQIVCVSKL